MTKAGCVQIVLQENIFVYALEPERNKGESSNKDQFISAMC